MILASGLIKAYETKWSMANTFTIDIVLPEAITNNLKKDGKGLDVEFTQEFGTQINLHIVSMDTPDFTNDPIEAFVANKWRVNNGKQSVKQFTMTFRDHNQMSLYKKFIHLYDVAQVSYFDDIAMTITITKDADWAGENDQVFMEIQGAIVMAISNLAFSNTTESQIAEFTVTFKCVSISAPMTIFKR